MFAALDLATGEMFYRSRDRKRAQEFLDFCNSCGGVPGRSAYLACDIYGAHQKDEVTSWCADQDIELVFTPSNASWLNWIVRHDVA